jgi:Right handed beta helix region
MNTRFASLFIISLLLHASFIPTASAATPKDPVSFYVSGDGDDSWSGTLSAANASRTDGPFRTLDRARSAVRSVLESGTAPGSITVFLRKGVYRLDRTFRLSAEDSGRSQIPVVWRSSPGEEVIFSGGATVSGFQRVTDPEISRRLSPGSRRHIIAVDLRAKGMTDYGSISPQSSPGIELFYKDKRMTLARWPNKGWLKIADVPQSGDSLYNSGLEREKRFDGVPVGRHYGRITYAEDRPSGWAPEPDIYLHGYWTWDWSDAYQKVESIDTAKKEITFATPHHHYGYTKNQRYYYVNILEELDSPGEWYLDRVSGVLYFWPPGQVREGDVTISLLEGSLTALDSTANITVRGIVFEDGRGGGVELNGGHDNLIGGCVFRNLGGLAVLIDGGTRNGIRSSDIYDVALGGITLSGGDRPTLTPGDNYAENNHIHHWSRWVRTGHYAIRIDGVQNRLSHNLIHDAPFEAIYLRGNEHLIEYNEVHHVTQETGDAGALHTGRNWTWRGNVIRYNYWHHLIGPGLHGVMGVYLDDWASGFTIYGNLFYKAGRAAFIGGGRDNVVENNIFVDCAPSVHIDARGLGWAGYYFDGTHPTLFTTMDDMKFRQPPYSTRYPELLTLYDDEPRIPKNNRILRNVSYGGRWMDLYDYLAYDFSVVKVEGNVIADPLILRRRADGETGWDPYYLNIDMKEGYVVFPNGSPEMKKFFAGNMITKADPGFVNVKKMDFRLRKDSPAFVFGFTPIPIDKMGLRVDEFRPGLPARKGAGGGTKR